MASSQAAADATATHSRSLHHLQAFVDLLPPFLAGEVVADEDGAAPALLRRAARYISGAADLAANGGKLPDGIPETARHQLAATLRRDADGLIAITATY